MYIHQLCNVPYFHSNMVQLFISEHTRLSQLMLVHRT